ncbi:BnaA08g13870D [Brassica napus]|uniref:(rape) hypothetical protein n=1 Tax=Brassica napus TaxID=3708 RepID=A0A078FMB1_BRANA|nr:unnamed protein product [Brassica napus]CDY14256.1 BnaA08g13870D [Brassica napus]
MVCSGSIRTIVCLNLPSFSGGQNPWGTPNPKKQCDRSLSPDDGLIEIIGLFRNAWHGLCSPRSKGSWNKTCSVVCVYIYRQIPNSY